MGVKRYTCKSTGTTMVIDAKNPKDAAQQFVDEIMKNLYTVKLKKCTAISMKRFPDSTVTVIEQGGSGKELYFQYTSMMPRY